MVLPNIELNFEPGECSRPPHLGWATLAKEGHEAGQVTTEIGPTPLPSSQ